MAKTIDNLVGQNFEGRYLIEEVLGENEVSRLYRANQLSMQRSVAIRISNEAISQDPEKAARFEMAAEAIGAIQHPNIINLIDFGRSEGDLIYLVREFVEGERLHQLMERSAPLGHRRVLHILMQILDAMAEAHRHGIVHRDLNPRSVFLHQVGASGDFIKVFDFRVGIPTSAQRDSLVSQDPHYMAPEQIRGEGVSPKTDLYALGILGYHLLTGQPPFRGPDRPAIVAGHIEKLPEPPMRKGKILCDPLSDLIMQCLHKSPDERPSGAADMLAYLELPHHLEAILSQDSGDTQSDLGPAPLSSPLKEAPRQKDAAVLEETHIEFADEVEVSLDVDCNLPDAVMDTFEEPVQPSSTPVTLFILALLAVGALLAVIYTQRKEPSVLSRARVMQADVVAAAKHELPRPALGMDASTNAEDVAQIAADGIAPGPEDVSLAKDTSEPAKELPKAASKSVRIEVEPAGALVFRGKERLGAAPYEIVFSEGDQKIELRIWADGYKTVALKLKREDLGSIRTIRLKKTVKKKKKKKKKKDRQEKAPSSLKEAMED